MVVVMVVVAVLMVVMEVVVVRMSDDKAGSCGWSIIHFLDVFCYKKSCRMDRRTNKTIDQWTNKPATRDLIESGVDV